MKVSIITVCLNAEKTIKKTIKSVNIQYLKNYEHVFVDGDSKDNTVKIIKEFSKNPIIIQGKDKGLYDAMNKGVKIAKGEYILFLNADDELISSNVLTSVNDYLYKNDLVYCNSRFYYPIKRTEKQIIRTASLNKIKTGDMPQHQSCFVKKKWLEKYPFNLKWNIVADYDFFCNLFKHKIKIKYLNNDIARVRIGGKSSNLKNTWFEQEQIIKEHFGYYYWFLMKTKHFIFELIKKVIKC